MVLAKAKVADFDQFLSVFTTRGAEQRKSFGSKGSQVFRNEEEPNEVYVLFDWDQAGWEKFVADPTTQEIIAAAGLLGPPEPVFLSAETTVGS